MNFNTTNSNDIYAEEEEDGVDFLRDLQFYDDEEMNQIDISQNPMSESHIDDNLQSESENSHLNASAGSSRSNEHNVINNNFHI